MPSLSWKHHTLIQAVLSRGPLTEKEFHTVFIGVTGRDPNGHQQLFNECLLNINKELAYVQFELRACCNQYDGNIYYGVVNNVTDEQAKLGTNYSVPQIAFYKGIIEAIVQDSSAQGTISEIQALNVRLDTQVQNGTGSESQGSPSNVPPAIRNFSLSQKEKTLNELVQDRWLWSTSDGNIGLGVRSFLDLRSWFRNNDVPSCNICNEAGVKVHSKKRNRLLQARLSSLVYVKYNLQLETRARKKEKKGDTYDSICLSDMESDDEWITPCDDDPSNKEPTWLDVHEYFKVVDDGDVGGGSKKGRKAELCRNEGCNVRIHKYCLKKKFSQKRAERVCPGCGTEWFIAKREVIEEDEEVEPSEPTSARRKKLRRYKTEAATDTVGAGPSQSVSSLRRSTRSSAHSG